MKLNERIEASIDRVAALLADGLQVDDAAAFIHEAVECAEAIGEVERLSGPEKRALALDLVDRFLTLAAPQVQAFVDKLADTTDGPGPDWLVDPIVKRAAVPIVVGTIKRVSPALVDLVIKASRGDLALNGSTGTE